MARCRSSHCIIAGPGSRTRCCCSGLLSPQTESIEISRRSAGATSGFRLSYFLERSFMFSTLHGCRGGRLFLSKTVGMTRMSKSVQKRFGHIAYIHCLEFCCLFVLFLLLLKCRLEGVYSYPVGGKYQLVGQRVRTRAFQPVKTPRPAAIITAIAGPPALILPCGG